MLRSLVLCLSFFPLISTAFDWQGHRGARGLYPENTINAMKEALKYPVNTLELDVVISKDNQIVVSHEPWMSEEICLSPKGEAIKNRQVNLYKMSYADIAKYDCGSKSHPRFPRQKMIKESKPLLKDLIKDLVSSGKNFNIEIKSTIEDEKDGFQPEYKKFTDEVISLVKKLLPLNRFSIQSFDWRVLKYLNEKYPDVTLVALRESAFTLDGVITELGFSPDIFSPDYELITAADVASFHEKKIKVIPWTVNTTEAMNKMIAMHVDGIITDYPDLIKDVPASSFTNPVTCKKGYNSFERNCVKIPRHALASEQNPGWVCKYGYSQKRDSCIKIKLPRHAVFAEDGKTWVCKDGYERYRYKCKKK